MEDSDRIAASFAEEDPAAWTPPGDVLAAEAVLAALARRDVEALPALLAKPLRGSVEQAVKAVSTRLLMLIDRRSFAAGPLREVRVRIDAAGETTYGSMMLEREGESWVVVAWDELLK